jgi:hypothetical protein
MAIYTELQIYKDGCALLGLALEVQTQIKREFKRSLGEKVSAMCVEMLEAIAMANACRGEMRVQQIDTVLRLLRAASVMLRVAFERRLISKNLWGQSIEVLDAVGKQSTGWRKATLADGGPGPGSGGGAGGGGTGDLFSFSGYSEYPVDSHVY